MLLGLLVFLVLVAGHYELGKSGTIHLLLPPEGAALSFDGKPVEIQSTMVHQRFEVRPGPNFVRVINGNHLGGPFNEFSLDIREGFDAVLVPASEEQCFVSFELSRAGPPTAGLRLRGRHDDRRPLEVGGVRYFGVAALPKAGTAQAGALLVEQIACVDVHRSETEILSLIRARQELGPSW